MTAILFAYSPWHRGQYSSGEREITYLYRDDVLISIAVEFWAALFKSVTKRDPASQPVSLPASHRRRRRKSGVNICCLKYIFVKRWFLGRGDETRRLRDWCMHSMWCTRVPQEIRTMKDNDIRSGRFIIWCSCWKREDRPVSTQIMYSRGALN